jgi:protein SCO1
MLKFFFKVLILFFMLFSVSCSAIRPGFRGEVVKPVTPAPEINMVDHNGHPFKLSDEHGKVALVFFGFTNCVNECPLTLAHFKLALEALGNDAGQVQVVMVSTDPIRDTPQALHNFMGKFNPAFIGIPGTVDELSKLWNAYEVIVLDGGETHSSFTYVVDKQGRLRLHFDPEMAPEDIASDLKVLLSE